MRVERRGRPENSRARASRRAVLVVCVCPVCVRLSVDRCRADRSVFPASPGRRRRRPARPPTAGVCAAMAVLVTSRRDNVVSISVTESLKMLAYSVVWGSWIVFKKVAAMVVGPLWLGRYGIGAAAAGKDAPNASGGRADERLQQLVAGNRGYRPPPCLSSSVYGVHSYVKIKVNPSSSNVDCFRPSTHVFESSPQAKGAASIPKEFSIDSNPLWSIDKKGYRPQRLKTKYCGGIWLPRTDGATCHTAVEGVGS